MLIKFSTQFTRSYKKLSSQNKDKVDRAIEILKSNPFDSRLKNHVLKGEFGGVRSISAAYDLRILYHEQGGHAYVYMLKVGKHDDVY